MTEDGASRRKGRGGRGRRARLQRMLDDTPRAGARTWLHLALLVAALVLLFAIRDEFGKRAAGCYGSVAEGEGEGPDGLRTGLPGDRAEGEGAFSTRIEVAPLRDE